VIAWQALLNNSLTNFRLRNVFWGIRYLKVTGGVIRPVESMTMHINTNSYDGEPRLFFDSIQTSMQKNSYCPFFDHNTGNKL
jgi:hypothetical protein